MVQGRSDLGLPQELLEYIFTCLSLKELVSVAHVCKHWHTVSNVERIWQEKTKAVVGQTKRIMGSWKETFKIQVIICCSFVCLFSRSFSNKLGCVCEDSGVCLLEGGFLVKFARLCLVKIVRSV